EICEAADVNRSTFYTHYADQHDLLQQIEQELLREINAYLEGYNFKQPLQNIQRIFEFVRDNAGLCRVLLGEHGDIAIQREIMMLVQRQIVQEWRNQARLDDEIADYSCLFIVDGCIAIVQRWLQTGLRQTPDEIAELVLRLTYHGLASYVGEEGT
ncbi:MAG: TetR family transcriptional regulator C-terminal domain-containing protein, partial [Oscillospiraceae bacterium]|nr:TetR family transcriptional regulator C-terminal domain-containing protein [Oscillospiraceae bacterium]